MTVEQLLQRLVELAGEGRGQCDICTEFAGEDGFFSTWPDYVRFDEKENEVIIYAGQR